MQIRYFLFCLLAFAGSVHAQTPSAQEILSRSIQYHDPQGTWGKVRLHFTLEESRPNGPTRQSQVEINLPESIFKISQTRDSNIVERTVSGDQCAFALNGKSNLSEAEIKQFGLTCDRSISTRNYYTYLWGLPMKLKDPGTILHQEVEQTDYFGKPAYKLKVSYDAAVGSDTWYFYFDPATYALVGYRFYHDEAKNDGEYILLDHEIQIGNLRLPQTRKWYTHQDEKFLGADTLVEGK